MPTYTNHTISIDLIRWKENPNIAMMDLLYLKGIKVVSRTEVSSVQFGDGLYLVPTRIHPHGKIRFSPVCILIRDTFILLKGLRGYKEKFKPNWEGKYLVYNKKSLFRVLYSCYCVINTKI